MMWPFRKRKQVKKQKRYYQTALKDNLAAGWKSTILSADTPLNSDLESLRARSRLLSGNDPYYKYWLKLQNRNNTSA